MNHLLLTLYKCQQIGIRDKFFYDALLEKIFSRLERIVQARELIMLGVALGSNQNFQKDHAELLTLFYAHVYQHRFLFTQNEKKQLASIFQQINVGGLFKKHLDLFAEMSRK